MGSISVPIPGGPSPARGESSAEMKKNETSGKFDPSRRGKLPESRDSAPSRYLIRISFLVAVNPRDSMRQM